jgi:hypothetical protein
VAATVFQEKQGGAYDAKRRRWLSEILVPVAHEYLSRAECEDEETMFSLGDATASAAAIEEMRDAIELPANFAIPDPSSVIFKFNQAEFEKVLHKALGGVVRHFASVIASSDADLVLMSGRTTGLPAVQRMVARSLPFTKSRIIAMGDYHTGDWYPLPKKGAPGRIGDPKSVVVVGSAIEFLASSGQGLGNFRLTIERPDLSQRTYYWGVANYERPRFDNEEALFQPDATLEAGDEQTFLMVGRQLVIARRLASDPRMMASPIYCLTAKHDQVSSQLQVTLRRTREGDDEHLELIKVEGMVNGRPARIHVDVTLELRTMYAGLYFLDDFDALQISYEAIEDAGGQA